ncbi:DUF2231 domain-containing protein [Aureimonas psammosilenae]|uniref:DUF2231 domain-containing protein n=1 Tax=Aureimonas psammosilenae TaxID=2495496 RepID=UPI0012608014|nr:DUF2231 domain-containing protein [Aureimonas psammosilenae]
MAKSTNDPSPVIQAVAKKDISSAVAIAGHPIHAMAVHFPIALAIATLGADVFYWWSADPFWLRAGLWAAGFSFATGVAASLVGTAELLLVPGIRSRAASWTHAIAAMMFVSICGMNWVVRLVTPDAVLPLGLALSGLGAVFTGLAGWHGGKLILHHGVGIMVSDDG